MEASCTVQTLRNSCKFFSESDKKNLAKAISKNQVSDPGPSWPSCLTELMPMYPIQQNTIAKHGLQCKALR